MPRGGSLTADRLAGLILEIGELLLGAVRHDKQAFNSSTDQGGKRRVGQAWRPAQRHDAGITQGVEF